MSSGKVLYRESLTILTGNRMKKVWWVVILILAQVVYAQESETFFVSVSPQQLSVKLNETAVYDLTIANNNDNAQIFEVYSPDVLWDVRTDRALFVAGRRELSAKLLLHPLSVNTGLYGVPVVVRRVGTADSVKHTVFLEILSNSLPVMNYLPAFRGNASMSKQVEPNKQVIVALTVENLNRRNLSDVSVKIRSTILNKDYLTALEPRERKALSFSVVVDKSVPPQKDVLRIHLIKTENDKSYQYEVQPLEYEVVALENVAAAEFLEEEWFKTTIGARLKNVGNVPQNGVFVRKMSFFKRLFSRASPETEVVNGAYVWSLPLDVGEERTVSVVTNYRSVAVTVGIALLIFVLYLLLRSPLKIRKTASIVTTKEGGISELKVRLNVKNRSGKVIRNINLIDLVPRIADVVRHFETSASAPSQIVTHDKRGTLLKWNFDALDSGEEYILTYKMTSKFSILGGATLPVVVAKFTNAEGKEQTTSSNKFKVKMPQ